MPPGELLHVAVQVLLAEFTVRGSVAVLESRPEGLQSLNVDLSLGPLLDGVVDVLLLEIEGE